MISHFFMLHKHVTKINVFPPFCFLDIEVPIHKMSFILSPKPLSYARYNGNNGLFVCVQYFSEVTCFISCNTSPQGCSIVTTEKEKQKARLTL